jgi:hypothetical protein
MFICLLFGEPQLPAFLVFTLRPLAYNRVTFPDAMGQVPFITPGFVRVPFDGVADRL